MQFRIEEVSPVEKRLAVEIEWPMVAARLDAAYKELGRGVTLKGFRKGKVPRNMLERMFAHQVEQQVTRELVQESFARAAQKHELKPVAEPIVDQLEFPKNAPFKYSARVEVRADIEPKGYDGIELKRPEPHVGVEEIDRALERKREELAEYKKIEGREALAGTDVCIVELKGDVAGKLFHRDGVMVDLSKVEGEPVAGLVEGLRGAPVAAKDHPIKVTVDHEGGEKHQATLMVTVKDAREKSVPALDDDFAKDTGEADSLDELRGKVREQLVETKKEEIERDLRGQLVKELLKKNEFAVAPSLVERQSEVLVHRAKLQMMMQGIDIRNAPLDENKMKESVKDAAADEVRAAFLLEAIAEKEKLEVSDADIEKRLAKMAKQRNTSAQRLKAELQKEGRFESLRYQIREEKTLDLLLSRANITPSSEAPMPSEK